ncbi:hydroxymethylbilane synthase [Desulfovibrio psychrotolerans]|uniref:Porphobilinogen deaminase n=1 Tax=Desulfovibrio psychrotolerans TaxID=415242 RepID=A0A7J0BSN1_9BACT|nr:hydroxymethylbilane synthase [Desulfovibrio psychrotolerans]GFM36699.1 porphobilinogen deaminase [Desulfovibrio psychrotolerans]
MKNIVIATRGSKLALWQANHIKDCIERQHSGAVSVDLLVLKTKGDIILDVPLAKVGGKGLFVKEIEEALLDGRADLAVHSMKDVPMELPEGLVLGTIPQREDASDTFLSVHHDSLDALPQGATVGTSSLRRQSQLLTLRPDLNVVSLRGNVDTRLRKLMENQFDAIIMATSGLKRLGLTAPRHEILGPPRFLPAVGQGALGIEYHAEREDVRSLLAFLEHTPTRICVEAERGFLFGLQGGCQVPIAGHAVMTGEETFSLTGFVADLEGRRIIRHTVSGAAQEARAVGLRLAETVKAEGAGAILEEVYAAGNAVRQ